MPSARIDAHMADKQPAITAGRRGRNRMVPVFLTMEKKLFRRVRIVIGAPYSPVYTGRKGTAEEYQANAEEIMRKIYALGDMEWK